MGRIERGGELGEGEMGRVGDGESGRVGELGKFDNSQQSTVNS